MYYAITTPTLLYGSETWTIHVRHLRKIECFQQRRLRQLMGIKWQDKISNVETQKHACAIPTEVAIRKNRLRWLGHACRMDDHRSPKQVLFSELQNEKRNRGRPHKRWKDCIMEDFKLFQMEDYWQSSALDRKKWRRQLFDGQ